MDIDSIAPKEVYEDSLECALTLQAVILIYAEACRKQYMLRQVMLQEKYFGVESEAIKLRDKINSIDESKRELLQSMEDYFSGIIDGYDGVGNGIVSSNDTRRL